MKKQPFFVLAPMDDVTDTVFRQVIGECAAPDLYFTEFVNVDGLCSPGRPKLYKKLQFNKKDQPLIVQLWGKTPENYYDIARQIVSGELACEANGANIGNYSGIDINMGCPEKSVVNNGCCSGLINNRDLAVEIIQAVVEASSGKLPVSVKTRLGFNEIDFTWHELLLKQSIDRLTVHGRTRKEMSKVLAHWDSIAEVVKLKDKISPNVQIVGNGDVKNKQHGIELAQASGVDGIMIGRGVFEDPYAFSDNSPWNNLTRQRKIDLYKYHVSLFASTWQSDERPVHTLNKFCKVYISGFDGAKELRERLMDAGNTAELLNILNDASESSYSLFA